MTMRKYIQVMLHQEKTLLSIATSHMTSQKALTTTTRP